MALEPLFDDICAAIHEKDGKTDGIMARDFPARIRAIPAGGTEPAGPGWHRPSSWPDYSKISLDGFEGMYFTYDTSRAASDPTEFCAFTVTTQGSAPYLVERGQIVGGAFVAEESYSVGSRTKFAEWLAQAESGYVVYRVTSDAPITNIQMSTSDKYDGGERTSYTQPCVERYGRLPNVNSFSNWRISSVVGETILDCKRITNLANCWFNCTSLTSLDLSGWDVSAVTNMGSCWQNCSSLVSLDLSGWDTSALTGLANCWAGCNSLVSLDLSGWDTSAVTGLNYCWFNCTSLTSLDLSGWDVSAVTNMATCWMNCTSLTSLDLSGWDVSAVTNMGSCWQNCNSLVSLDLSGWDTSAVTNQTNCWAGCNSLMQLKFCPIPISFSLSDSPNLTVTSLLNVLENLPAVETRQTATIGAANKAKLTDEQIAAAAEKGWNVA